MYNSAVYDCTAGMYNSAVCDYAGMYNSAVYGCMPLCITALCMTNAGMYNSAVYDYAGMYNSAVCDCWYV